jgi:hypothetical protein
MSAFTLGDILSIPTKTKKNPSIKDNAVNGKDRIIIVTF